MKSVFPKEFIEEYLIKQIRQIIDENHPYLAFVLMASGIEFLGKCLNPNSNWDHSNSGPDIDNAVKQLMPRYKKLNLRNELRNGLLHMLRPKTKLALEYKGHNQNAKHLDKYLPDTKRIILEVTEFYEDFKNACHEIIRRIDSKEFNKENKINKPFIKYD